VDKAQQFVIDSAQVAFDKDHRSIINYNIEKYDAAVVVGKQQFSDIDLAKRRAQLVKSKVVENLDKYLVEFEANFIRRGGKIIWAQDSEEALSEIKKITDAARAKLVVKSKSMVTEEIGINEALEKDKIESIETDLGEYIQQLSGEKPYHIVTPAMHRSKESVAALFHEHKQLQRDSSPNEITEFVRRELRDKFIAADIGITGANFLIADTGAIVITENEGNAINTVSFPKIHIAISGIEKLLPTLGDTDIFISLLATYGTGQQLTAYNSILTGPRQQEEEDGPEEMYLVLLNNGRSELLALPEQRQALGCIKCGACLNACPVYKNVGGHTYGTVYSGPIGAVISPHLNSPEEFAHLSNASSMCGKCTVSCPVGIEVHKLLLYNRRDFVKGGLTTKTENIYRFFWKSAMMKRGKMDKGGAKVKNFMLRQFFRKQWGESREMPVVATRSFNQVWRDRKGIK
jgi:L-lactate dehydrogenase complex protein LldF